jgi:hypothetical protein
MSTNAANENAGFIACGVERDSVMDRGNLADLTAFVAVADGTIKERHCYRYRLTRTFRTSPLRRMFASRQQRSFEL